MSISSLVEKHNVKAQAERDKASSRNKSLSDDEITLFGQSLGTVALDFGYLVDTQPIEYKGADRTSFRPIYMGNFLIDYGGLEERRVFAQPVIHTTPDRTDTFEQSPGSLFGLFGYFSNDVSNKVWEIELNVCAYGGPDTIPIEFYDYQGEEENDYVYSVGHMSLYVDRIAATQESLRKLVNFAEVSREAADLLRVRG